MRKKEAKAAAAKAAATHKEEEEEEKIEEDSSLPKAQTIKIRQAVEKKGDRVLVKGWVNTVRVQSKSLVFVDLRDGSDLELQCVLSKKLVIPSVLSDDANCRQKAVRSKNSLSKPPLLSMASSLPYSLSILAFANTSGHGRQNRTWRH
jgi:hypothetical protein